MVFGMENDFDECKQCIYKFTTNCWVNCKIYNIKHSIQKLNEYISSRFNLDDDLIAVNKKYYMYVKKYSKINLVPNTLIILSDLLDDNIVSVIIHKSALNDYKNKF